MISEPAYDISQKDYVANPCRAWVTGNKERAYTFTAGKYPYHCRLPEKGCIRFNVLIMADNVNHVYSILEEYIAFRRQCEAEYQKTQNRPSHMHGARLDELEKQVKATTMDISRINMDQMFKIGWASNDRL